MSGVDLDCLPTDQLECRALRRMLRHVRMIILRWHSDSDRGQPPKGIIPVDPLVQSGRRVTLPRRVKFKVAKSDILVTFRPTGKLESIYTCCNCM